MERPYVPANEHAPGPRGGAQANGECPNEARIGKIEARLDDFGLRLDEIGTSLNEVAQRETVLQVQPADNVARETTDNDRVEFLAKRINALESRIVTLENRPHVSENTINSLNDALHAKLQTLIEKKVNAALGDLRSRVISVEKSSTSLTTQKDPDSAKLTRLATMLQAFGEMVREIETSVDQRQTDIEQQHAELREHITENNLQVMKMSTRLYRALAALEHDEEGKAA